MRSMESREKIFFITYRILTRLTLSGPKRKVTRHAREGNDDLAKGIHMADLKVFSRRIKARAKNASKNTDNLMRKVILAVDQAVVLATPVDTGRARANWRPNIGSAIEQTLPEPGGPNIGTSLALKAGEDVAASYKGGANSPTVHITNNLPYIKYLNEGSSQQAPANFVNQSILIVKQVIGGNRIIVG
jgi:hypothetical protein